MQYSIGDYVVHEGSSVCRIDEIVDMELAGKGSMRTYYTMTPVYKSGAQVFTPVEGSRLRLRDVTTAEHFQSIVDNLEDIEVINEPADRARQEKYKQTMLVFTPEALASVVKTVLVRRKMRALNGKKVMAGDEKVLAIAGKKLYEEMAFAMDVTVSDAQSLFEEKVATFAEEAARALA